MIDARRPGCGGETADGCCLPQHDSRVAVESIHDGRTTQQNRYNQEGQGNHQYNATSITINGQTHEASARKVAAWLNAPDPRSNHDTARRQRHANTGTWLLQCDTYTRWKTEGGHIWLYAQPGAGKTVLCSMVAQDLLELGLYPTAFFYFTFSDNQKQSYEQLLLSLVAQVAHGNATLLSLYERKQRPTLTDLEHILIDVSNRCDTIAIIIDALDECPEEARESLFEGLEKLAGFPSFRLFLTSRDYIDIRDGLAPLGVQKLSATPPIVDDDISRWLAEQLAKPIFARFNAEARETIRCSISGRARGMFRWASLQLEQIRKLKITRPEAVGAKLTALPETLDGMYEHMLLSLESSYHQPAIHLLTWLTYSFQPLTLYELAESMLIDIDSESVSFGDRGSFLDSIGILTGLVAVIADGADDFNIHRDDRFSEVDDKPLSKDTRIRLAHFSVQEYLESSRIRDGPAQQFAMVPSTINTLLMRSCLVYITCYSENSAMLAQPEDLTRFPLLSYAAHYWHKHLEVGVLQEEDLAHVTQFLGCKAALTACLRVHDLRMPYVVGFNSGAIVADGSYLASYLGLDAALQGLLSRHARVDTRTGYYGTALQAAAHKGYEYIVRLLLEAGADVNLESGCYNTALQAAAAGDHIAIVRSLIDAGANVNTEGGACGSALRAAASNARIEIVQLLLDAGAHVDGQNDIRVTALQAAVARASRPSPAATSREDFLQIVRLLVNAGADVNARRSVYQTVLQAAISDDPSIETIQLLLDAGADVNQVTEGGTALSDAIWHSSLATVKCLLDAGADVNLLTIHGTALQVARRVESRQYGMYRPELDQIIALLVERGAVEVAESRAGAVWELQQSPS